MSQVKLKKRFDLAIDNGEQGLKFIQTKVKNFEPGNLNEKFSLAITVFNQAKIMDMDITQLDTLIDQMIKIFVSMSELTNES